jgi:hypothetical protein
VLGHCEFIKIITRTNVLCEYIKKKITGVLCLLDGINKELANCVFLNNPHNKIIYKVMPYWA